MTLQQRFRKLNPNGDWDVVDLDNIGYPCEYTEALFDTANTNPRFKWYDDSDPLHLDPQKPWPSAEEAERARFEEEAERNRSSVKIELKLYFQKSKKGDEYAYVKGTIGKKILKSYRTRLCEEVVVDWPIRGIITEEELKAPNTFADSMSTKKKHDSLDLGDSLAEEKIREFEESEKKKPS
jgi:hypothetical protein